jgi:hypothetical protein
VKSGTRKFRKKPAGELSSLSKSGEMVITTMLQWIFIITGMLRLM